MLRRAAATAVVLAGVLAPAAHADGGGGVCEGAGMDVTVCASDDTATPGSSGSEEQQEWRRREQAHAALRWKIQPQRSSSAALVHRGDCALYPVEGGFLT
ncbi:hypothetical protein [Streptomyces sp. NPDC001933]|uniref:hypothetical protein n=1 Tax=Streptomyces sp. NPDC001933 TaxID=3364626 RepID=UPI0036A5EB5E